MDCPTCREALSAQLDHEVAQGSPGGIDGHLSGCASCRAWLATAQLVTRTARLAPAVPVPDLVEDILDRRLPPAPSPLLRRWFRTGVSWNGTRASLLLVSVLRVVGGAVGVTSAGHSARELAVWQIAISVGLALAAWRPRQAAALLPVVAVAVALLTATSVLDVLAGRALLVDEGHHALDAVGLGLLWVVAGRPRPHPAVRVARA